MEFAPSTTVSLTDLTMYFIFAVSVFFIILVNAIMVFFVIRYSRRRHPVPGHAKSHFWLEVIWTAVPTFLVLIMFYLGYISYRVSRKAPAGAMEIGVTGRMWAWSFEYPNKKITQALHVPVGRPINLRLESRDVIHSLYIPAFRIKRDAMPGRVIRMAFTPLETGTYDILCAEYCGVGHSAMNTTLVAMDPRDFEIWYTKPEAQRPISMADAIRPNPEKLTRGKEIYAAYCVTCHGATGHGEALAGARNFAALADWKNGPAVTAMFRTISEGLNRMPSFPNLSVQDRFAIIHYVRETFVPQPRPESTPQQIAQLDRTYSLTKGSIPPPSISIEEAMKKIAQETATTSTAPVRMPVKHPTQAYREFLVARNESPQGASLYGANCASCHGDYGEGKAKLQAVGVYRPSYLGGAALNSAEADWRSDISRFRQRMRESSVATGGAKPLFATFSESDWQALFRFVQALAGTEGSAQ